ncbi:MAG: tetratricopeptide repeat protein, partial [bacterium]|nr:tetratricopeptide repeat protein [bacterium]
MERIPRPGASGCAAPEASAMIARIFAISAALVLAWPYHPAAHSSPKDSAVQVAPLPAAYPRLLQAKKYDELLERLQNDPSGLGGRKPFLLGYALLQAKRHGDAIAHFEEAIRKTPEIAAHALFFLAQSHRGAGDNESALRALQKMLQRDPGIAHAPEALEHIARIEIEESRHGDAARTLEHLLRRFPDHERFAAFLALAARTHEMAGNHRAAALAWRRLWMDHGETPEAKEALEKTESLGFMARPRLEPMTAWHFYQRARRLQKRYYYQEAYDSFQQLKSRFPGSLYERQIILNEALTLYALRRTDQARPALERAISLYPVKNSDRAMARYHLLRNHLRANDRTGFGEDSRLLLEESPEGKWAARGRYLLARVHEDSGRYEDATRSYQEVVRFHPASPLVPKAMWQLAWIQYRSRKFQNAQQEWEELGRRFPNHSLASSALYWSAAAAEKSGKPQEAAARYRRAVQIYRHLYF